MSSSMKAFIKSTVVLEKVEIVYELHAEFDDYEATSTQVFVIDGLEYELN
jgi:hypothetical protein